MKRHTSRPSASCRSGCGDEEAEDVLRGGDYAAILHHALQALADLPVSRLWGCASEGNSGEVPHHHLVEAQAGETEEQVKERRKWTGDISFDHTTGGVRASLVSGPAIRHGEIIPVRMNEILPKPTRARRKK